MNDSGSKQVGLYDKYLIIKKSSVVVVDGEEQILSNDDGTVTVTFIPDEERPGVDRLLAIKPVSDPAALKALMAYRDNCHPELAKDLSNWINAILAQGLRLSKTGHDNLVYSLRESK